MDWDSGDGVSGGGGGGGGSVVHSNQRQQQQQHLLQSHSSLLPTHAWRPPHDHHTNASASPPPAHHHEHGPAHRRPSCPTCSGDGGKSAQQEGRGSSSCWSNGVVAGGTMAGAGILGGGGGGGGRASAGAAGRQSEEEEEENHNLVSLPPVALLPASCARDPGSGEYEGEEYACGLWSWRPRWAQWLANKQTFLIVFSLTSILQGMYYTYFVSVLTTIEKLYQIQSKTTGIIMSATEIGQIGGALLLTYYGGQGHRPKWIATGMLIFAAASIICATPHFLFGGQSLLAPALPSTSPSDPSFSSPSSSSTSIARGNFSQSLCQSNLSSSSFSSSYRSHGLGHSSDVHSVNHKCEDAALRSAQSKVTTSVLSIFFVSLFLVGIGATAVNTLGIPYIDDNVAPKESPLYFGITIGVKIFGPVFGFLLGSVCTSIYVDFPFENASGLSPSDPQWISAWWLGVLIVGFSLMLTSLPMIAFPKKLPSPDPSSYCHRQQQQILQQQKKDAQSALNGNAVKDGKSGEKGGDVAVVQNTRPSLRDFPAAVKRLLRNKMLLLRTASSVLHILPIAGLYTFLPKYLESQFRLTASQANMISGMAGILVMGFGIFASGMAMRRLRPSARFVAAWIAAAALAYAVGMVILMFLGCDQETRAFAGLNNRLSFTRRLESLHTTCGSECSCPAGEFSPICTSDGITYLSPCIAGCTQVRTVNNSVYQFSECLCLGEEVTAVNGSCERACPNLLWYIVIFSLFVLIHSTQEVGSMLLTLRCVEPADKAMALGLVSFSIGLFGNVPCPIVYGAVVDSSCLFWEKTCGEAGACRLYDARRFRLAFHGITAAIMCAAFAVDAAVWFLAKDMSFDDDEQAAGDEKTEQPDKELVLKLKSESSV